MRCLNLVLLALLAVFLFAADADAQRRGRGAGGPPGVSASAPPRDNSSEEKQDDNQDKFAGPQNGNRQGPGGGGFEGPGDGAGQPNQGNGNRNNVDTTDIIRKDPLLKIADINGDGKLDWEEIDMISRILHEMDWNNDGRLTTDEVNFGKAKTNNDRDMAAQGRKTSAADRDPTKPREYDTETEKQLFSFDRNSDGKLSRSELPGYLRSIMSTADKNKDRLLDEFEIADYAASVESDKK